MTRARAAGYVGLIAGLAVDGAILGAESAPIPAGYAVCPVCDPPGDLVRLQPTVDELRP